MIKKVKRVAVLLICGLVSVSAHANIYYYTELMLGTSKQYDNYGADYTPWGNDSSVGARIGSAFNQYIAVDAAYIQFGRVSRNQAEIEASAFQIGLVGSLPLGRVFAFYGRVGQSFSKGEYRYESFNNQIVSDNGASGSDPFLAVGVLFNVSDKLSLTVERSMNEMKWEGYENIVENTVLGAKWSLDW